MAKGTRLREARAGGSVGHRWISVVANAGRLWQKSGGNTMSKTVNHIAFIKFKADRTPDQIAEVFRIIEDLPRKIPGILRLTWGPNISPEGLDQGYTHSFIMTFESVAARDAYLPHPVHQAAVQLVVPQLESVIVCDHET